MDSIRYVDTRGVVTQPLKFSEAVIKGIAPGGGLFVPQEIPSVTLDEIASLAGMPYKQQAAFVYERFGIDFEREEIDALFDIIYGDNFDTPAIAPVVPVGEDGTYVLELWHGPTSAFKDMALQCLPVFFSASIEKQRAAGGPGHDYLIAVATSGDTGKAALAGFKDRDHISIVVFYPDGGVSDIQYKQMATQEGGNVCVYGVRGNFDDCQTSVKRMFNDKEFNEVLAASDNVVLSSANSINWGRLMPQIVYYVSAYSQMVAQGALELGEPMDVTVPTGNFGNILASWYAKQMGVPIGTIVCASNANRVLTDFIQEGTYSIEERELVLTSSPSMDILISSNLERQLFELTGRDAAKVAGWMAELSATGHFTIDDATYAAFANQYRAGSVGDQESLDTIKEVMDEHGYLLDPHTAVAWKVARRNKGANPMLVVSTARWAKFGGAVYRALAGIPAGQELPAEVASLTGAQLNRKVAQMAGVTGTYAVPPSLDQLDEMPIRFTEVVDGTTAAVEAAVKATL